MQPRQQLLTTATRVGEAAGNLKGASGIATSSNDKVYQDNLLTLAKSVANATAQLVLRAKAVATKTQNDQSQNAVIQSATQCALATSQLVAVTKVVLASASNSDSCQNQLSSVGGQVEASVDKLSHMAPQHCHDERLVGEMLQASEHVKECLHNFLQHIQKTPAPPTVDQLQNDVVNASEKIITQANLEGADNRETARCAGLLAQSASQLIVALRGIVAEEEDDAQKQRLLAAARQLAEATTRLVASAKLYTEQQNVGYNKQQIIEKASEIRNIVANMSQTEPREITSVEEQALADAVADGLDQFSACNRRLNEPLHLSKGNADSKAGPLNQLNSRIAAMSSAAAQAVSASAVANANIAGVDDVSNPAVVEMAVLTDAVVAIGMHAQPLVEDVRNYASFTGNDEEKQGILSACQALANSFVDLLVAARPKVQQDAGSPDERRQKLWSAASVVGQTSNEMMASINGASPEYERQFQEALLGHARGVSSSTAKLVLAAKGAANSCEDEQSKNRIIQSATQSALAASQLVAVTRVVLPCLANDQQCREQLVRSCGAVGIVAERLVHTTEQNCDNQSTVSAVQDSAAIVGKCVSELVKFVTTPILPPPPPSPLKPEEPTQQDETVDVLTETTTVVTKVAPSPPPKPVAKSTPPPPPAKKPSAANAVVVQTKRVMEAEDDENAAQEATALANVTSLLINALKDKANVETDEENRGRLLSAARQLADVTTKMLKAAALNQPVKDKAEEIQQIAFSTGLVQSVDRSSDKMIVTPPKQKQLPHNAIAIQECHNAVARLMQLRQDLGSGQVVSSEDFATLLQQAMVDARLLGDAVAQVSLHAKSGDVPSFIEAVRNFQSSLSGLSINSVQSFHNMPSPVVGTQASGTAGLSASIDRLIQAQNNIMEACDPLLTGKEPPSHDDLVNIAGKVAAQTKSICDTCKNAVGRSSDVNLRRQYVELAKEVATATTQLVQTIKDQQRDSDSTGDIVALSNATHPVLSSVDTLVDFVKKAAPTIEEQSEIEKRKQEFFANVLSTLDVGCSMLNVSKTLVAPTLDEQANKSAYQAYSAHSTQLSSNIKLVFGAIKSEDNSSPQSPKSFVSSPPPTTPRQVC